ncbi:asparagine synthase C-terminal domain-containing protein [Candidatus Woesearchaeota archaeon]|nr:asparagine synthase C-terminal domain-containing protein [Candidatus Woesearchaeota archaeon]
MQIIINNSLITEQDWNKQISKFRKETKIINNYALLKKDIKYSLIQAIKKRTPKQGFGVFFSGGVDSTLIAFILKRFSDDFFCYTIGFENSQDLFWAKKIAKECSFRLKHKTLTLEQGDQILKQSVSILGENANVVNVGVASVELACIQLAESDNINTFFSGLGSEEIFAGYQRHELSKDINKECWTGLQKMWQRDLIREYILSKATNTAFLTPFLDKTLIQDAMKAPSKYKIKNHIKKYILREIALEIGLKKEFAFRPKKAAQYGSGFDKILLKLTKKHGFKYKKDYIKYLGNNKQYHNN